MEIDKEEPSSPKAASKVVSTIRNNYLVLIFLHTYFLLKKNLKLSIRRWKTNLILLVILPIALCFIVRVFDWIVVIPLPDEYADPIYNIDSYELTNLEKCVVGKPGRCYTLIYTTQGNQFASRVMGNLTSKYENLQPYAEFAHENAMKEFIFNNPNVTLTAVAFSNSSAATVTKYTIYFNHTKGVVSKVPQIQTLIDSEIYHQSMIDQNLDYNTDVVFSPTYRGFPAPVDPNAPRVDIFDTSAPYYFLPFMILFLAAMLSIIEGKESKRSDYMAIMGLKRPAYWLSWIITYAFYNFIVTLIAMIASLATVSPLMLHVNIVAVFLSFYIGGISVIFVGFGFGTILSRRSLALVVGFIFVAFNQVLMEALNNAGTLYLLINANSYHWFLQFYPPFNVAKIYKDFSSKFTSHYSLAEQRYLDPVGYTFGDLFRKNENFNVTNVQETYWSFIWLFVNIAICVIVIFIVDNWNEGHGIFFFLKPSFYGIRLGYRTRKRDLKTSEDFEEIDDDLLNEYAASLNVSADVLGVPKNEGDTKEGDLGSYQMQPISSSLLSKINSNVKLDSQFALRISNLHKTFRSFLGLPLIGNTNRVLRGIDLNVEKGQCYALLGTNGVGKSTTMFTIAGLYHAQKGNAYIGGTSVRSNINRIRSTLGVCTQYDRLWGELSAVDHLQLFAEIKGLPFSEIKSEIEQRLHEVNLHHVRFNPVSTFSGGMKRRLSCAISFIGSPPVILLDEPTTGMDPASKRKVWEVVEKLKKNHAVIMTTHSMEEAEALGDKIGIMVNGKIRTVGTSLNIRGKYAPGFKLSISTTDGNFKRAEKFVSKYAPCSILKTSRQVVIFQIETKEMEKLEILIKNLESNEEEWLSEWGISHTTLEDVYVKVNNLFGIKDETEIKEETSEGSKDGSSTDLKKDIASAQKEGEQIVEEIELNEFKNSTENPDEKEADGEKKEVADGEKKEVADGEKKEIASEEHKEESASPQKVETVEVKIEDDIQEDEPSIAKKSNNFFILNISQFFALCFKTMLLQVRNYVSNIFLLLLPVFIMLFVLVIELILREVSDPRELEAFGLGSQAERTFRPSTFSMDSMIAQASIAKINEIDGSGIPPYTIGFTSSVDLGSKDYLGVGSGILNNVQQNSIYVPTNIPGTAVAHPPSPYPNNTLNRRYFPSFNQLQNSSDLHFSILNDISINQDSSKYFGAYHFTQWNSTNVAYTVQFDNTSRTTFCGLYQTAAETKSCDSFLISGLLNIVNSAFVHNATGGAMKIEVDSAQMPFAQEEKPLILTDFLGVFFFPIVFMILLPTLVYNIVLEKENLILEMMSLMGLKKPIYISVNILSQIVLYCIVLLEYIILGLIFNYRSVTQTNWLIQILMYIGWGVHLIGFTFLVASFIGKTILASVIGYLFVMLAPGVNLIFGAYILCVLESAGNIKCHPDRYPVLFLFGMPLTHMLGELSRKCSDDACLTNIDALWNNREIVISLIFMFLDGIIFFLLSFYFEKVIPQPFGLRRSPFYPIIDVYRFFKKCFTRNRKHVAEGSTENDEDLDVDVLQMKKDILEGKVTMEDSGVFIEGLVKKYGNGYVAVKNAYFNVAKRECLGLLGPNGAGKTTLIRMLSGLFNSSSGNAYINGYSIKTQMRQIRTSMGLCPQFDILWMNMTCIEHLAFYCAMKGVSPLSMASHINYLLKAVEITKFKFKKVKNLSAGTRRQLCIAIALVGNPSVILLDEPTTGLDASTTRNLWKIIKKAKERTCIIVTTHYMEEADALSDRIAIMCRGRIKCLGTPLRLKNRFGTGYRLSVNCEDSKKALKKINSILPTAKVTASMAKSFTLGVEKSDFKISDLFKEMEDLKDEGILIDWGLAQTTLEDVFIKISEADDQEIAKEAQEKKLGGPKGQSWLTWSRNHIRSKLQGYL